MTKKNLRQIFLGIVTREDIKSNGGNKKPDYNAAAAAAAASLMSCSVFWSGRLLRQHLALACNSPATLLEN